MAKKKKKKPKMAIPEQEPYNRELLDGVINENSYKFVHQVNVNTQNGLYEQWADNTEKNIQNKMWSKQGPLMRDCVGIAKNKAVIGIGSGQSFNKNKDILHWLVNRDGVKDWPDRDFVTIAANHQYKPLLEMGIIPDFVVLVDGSDVVYDQLCKDIPNRGQHTVLLTGLHCHPKVLSEWVKQGRSIRFWLNGSQELADLFKKLVNKNPRRHMLIGGGNVLNSAFMIAMTRFASTVFMAVGNDLSFELCEDMEERQQKYYADGDYSTNAPGTGTGRNEAATWKKWAGFTLEKAKILNPNDPSGVGRYNIQLDVVGTSHTLWVYKTWLEHALMQQLDKPTTFHYFNCSEGGILGVMAKDDSDEALQKQDNWFMLDKVCRFYHTAMLEDAATHFLIAKEAMKCPDPMTAVVQSAIGGAALH
jgi:hypothetical protein